MIVLLNRLLAAMALLGLAWFVRRLVGEIGRGQEAGPRPDAGGATRTDGPMVRDRVCNTFLPRSRAIRVTQEGEEYFFCSERCRSTFLSGVAPGASPTP